MIRFAIVLVLTALPMSASAQSSRTFYGSDGRVIGRSATDSQGTTTLYGKDGRALTRESTSPSGTTIYDAQSGRAAGKTTRESR